MNFLKYQLLLPLLLLLNQCQNSTEGKGNIITDDRTIESFHGVRMEGTANLVIKSSSDSKISIKGYENIVPLVKTTVKDGQLVISMKNKFNFHGGKLEVEVSTPALDEVEMTGAGNVEINSFNSSKMKLNLSGTGAIKFANSECDTVLATLSGAGNMYVNAGKYLDASVNGVGNIEYMGNPVVNSHINGVGKVEKK